MRTKVRLAVAVGGAVGSVGRVAVGSAVDDGLGWTVWSSPTALPWATLLVNVTGTVALALLSRRLRSPIARAGVLTGALGAWTTVSALALEVAAAPIRTGTLGAGDAQGTAVMAVVYLTVTLLAGVLAARVGSPPRGDGRNVDPVVRDPVAPS